MVPSAKWCLVPGMCDVCTLGFIFGGKGGVVICLNHRKIWESIQDQYNKYKWLNIKPLPAWPSTHYFLILSV